MRVFKQARRTHGDGPSYDLEKGQYVFFEAFGQGGFEEMVEDFFVGHVREGDLIEIVALHKFIEEVGTKNHGFRNGNAYTFVIFEYGVAFDE